MSKEKYQKQWEAMSQRIEKANSELLCFTYGSLVTQLLKDFEQVEAINTQLEKMGYNIGIRLVDEFLAKSGVGACGGFRETAEVIARERSCSLVLTENPLADFVELPPALANLNYCNLICGVIRGALEQLRMRVACYFVKDMLKGDDVYEIRLELKELMKEEFEDDEDA